MPRWWHATTLSLFMVASAAAGAQEPACRETRPVGTLTELWTALGKCWQPPATRWVPRRRTWRSG